MSQIGSWNLRREERVGDAVLRELSDASHSTNTCFEYELDGRVWRGTWDPREDGSIFYVSLDSWDVPEGEPISPRQRVNLVARMSEFASGRLMMEQVEGHSVMRSVGPTGFLLGIDGGFSQVRYWEVDHLVAIDCHRNSENSHVTLDLPERLMWTFPPGESIERVHWQKILGRIASTPGSERLDQLGTRIEVPGYGTSPGYDSYL